ncbi:ABC transporter substrate-binding protein [Jiangella anatolica]|uniref:Sugar ABC transporter substrate-binding protein n=1 Tax=Jiangella anatolica TaxID=2670374 RepID=A0A2W2BAE0_9ACTN|nr:sugar ABC transporter substrate-binding protein [Jiangella anatolica]PZF82180.1 sugar ABC transporter substrate-binding protein [Jiangella anatolica]
MRTTRWTRTAAAAAAAALTLTACSGGDDETGTSEGPVELRMVTWTPNEAHLAILNEIADEFVAAHPDEVSSVAIETTPAGENYRTVVTTQISGGDAPDVGWLSEVDALDFIDLDGLVDLGPTVRDDEAYAFDDLTPSAMELWSDGDAVYGIPFSTSPAGVFYNADMFAAAGLPTPDQMLADGTWTWENLAVAAKAISDSQQVAGFYIAPYLNFDQNWQFLSHVTYAYGGAPWNEDGTECTFDDAGNVDALTLLHDMIYTDGSYPTPGEVVDFAAGNAAMVDTFISMANTLESAPFQWGLVPLPSGPETSDGQTAVIGQSAVVAFAEGDHPDLAAEFVAFMTNEENSRKLSEFFPSIRTPLIDVDTLAAANPVLTPEQLQSVVVDGITHGRLAPTHAGMGDIQTEGRIGLESLWQPDADVQTALTGVCDRIGPLLAE